MKKIKEKKYNNAVSIERKILPTIYIFMAFIPLLLGTGCFFGTNKSFKDLSNFLYLLSVISGIVIILGYLLFIRCRKIEKKFIQQKK